jgi:hypothetical protein
MIDRTAHVIVSDDLRVEISGKYVVVGMYTGNIAIMSNPHWVNQLVVTFLISTPVDKPFASLKLEVTLPELPPATMDVALGPPENRPVAPTEARLWMHRIPMFLHNQLLRPGPSRARVIYEDGELLAHGIPLIVLAPQAFAVPMMVPQMSGPPAIP